LEWLEQRGVEVVYGVMEQECAHLNRAFFKWITTGTPWVLAKAAISLDGRLTRPPGEGRWLSGPAALRDAHRLRFLSDAVLVGAETLRADDPALTIRGIPLPTGKEHPWRVVLTRNVGTLPAGARLFTDEHRERTLVFEKRSLDEVMAELGGKRGVNQLLVEGGGKVLGAFFAAGLVDEVCFYVTPWICGGPDFVLGTPEAGMGLGGTFPVRLEQVAYKKLGRDLLMRGLVRRAMQGGGC
jgi:diaminohydroxyphosphoribosylaminopyrimidine deaminase/5-amino-6-(5-phosphoribosylamino)uracil reductase